MRARRGFAVTVWPLAEHGLAGRKDKLSNTEYYYYYNTSPLPGVNTHHTSAAVGRHAPQRRKSPRPGRRRQEMLPSYSIKFS